LGVVRSSVEQLTGGHAAVIFGKCRGSEPHAGSPRFAVVIFSAGAGLHAGRPELHNGGLSAVRAEVTGLGTSPVRHGVARKYVCVCWVERWRENARERKREIQPSFSPLGTTGANSMVFSSCF
jgi:hypothetical protein